MSPTPATSERGLVFSESLNPFSHDDPPKKALTCPACLAAPSCQLHHCHHMARPTVCPQCVTFDLAHVEVYTVTPRNCSVYRSLTDRRNSQTPILAVSLPKEDRAEFRQERLLLRSQSSSSSASVSSSYGRLYVAGRLVPAWSRKSWIQTFRRLPSFSAGFGCIMLGLCLSLGLGSGVRSLLRGLGGFRQIMGERLFIGLTGSISVLGQVVLGMLLIWRLSSSSFLRRFQFLMGGGVFLLLCMVAIICLHRCSPVLVWVLFHTLIRPLASCIQAVVIVVVEDSAPIGFKGLFLGIMVALNHLVCLICFSVGLAIWERCILWQLCVAGIFLALSFAYLSFVFYGKRQVGNIALTVISQESTCPSFSPTRLSFKSTLRFALAGHPVTRVVALLAAINCFVVYHGPDKTQVSHSVVLESFIVLGGLLFGVLFVDFEANMRHRAFGPYLQVLTACRAADCTRRAFAVWCVAAPLYIMTVLFRQAGSSPAMIFILEACLGVCRGGLEVCGTAICMTGVPGGNLRLVAMYVVLVARFLMSDWMACVTKERLLLTISEDPSEAELYLSLLVLLLLSGQLWVYKHYRKRAIVERRKIQERHKKKGVRGVGAWRREKLVWRVAGGADPHDSDDDSSTLGDIAGVGSAGASSQSSSEELESYEIRRSDASRSYPFAGDDDCDSSGQKDKTRNCSPPESV